MQLIAVSPSSLRSTCQGIAAPPTVYRALNQLMERGVVHRLESLNAFVACAHPAEAHDPAFMICRACDAVAEAQATPARGALGEAARAVGFTIERAVVEAEGLCPDCAEKAEP